MLAPRKDALLPIRQREFVANYVSNGFNGTKAAIDAGYSAKTADSQASRLLKNAKVAAAVMALVDPVRKRKEISAEGVLQNIADLAELDPRRLFGDDGRLVPIKYLPLEVARCITSLKVLTTKDGDLLTHIKFADVGQNNERLGRHLKLFTDKVEHLHKIERVVVERALKKERALPPATPEFEE
jgi:phage terminase small subunit